MIKNVKPNIQKGKSAFVLNLSAGPLRVLPNSWAALANGSTNGSGGSIPIIPIGLGINLIGRKPLLTKQILKSRRLL